MPKRGRPSKLQAARGQIIAYFENLPRNALTDADMAAILFKRVGEWRLAANTTVEKFVGFLLEATAMRMVSIVPVGETAYRTVELDSFLGVVGRQFQCLLRSPDHFGAPG